MKRPTLFNGAGMIILLFSLIQLSLALINDNSRKGIAPTTSNPTQEEVEANMAFMTRFTDIPKTQLKKAQVPEAYHPMAYYPGSKDTYKEKEHHETPPNLLICSVTM